MRTLRRAVWVLALVQRVAVLRADGPLDDDDPAAGVEPARPFLVLTQPRSTWFVKYSHEFAKARGVVTLGEALHPEIVGQKSRELLGRNATRVNARIAEYIRYVDGIYGELEKAIVRTADAAAYDKPKVVGFKLMYHQLPLSSDANGPAIEPGGRGLLGNVTLDALLQYVTAKRVLHIHLHRANQLERFITTKTIRRDGLGYHTKGAPTSYSIATDTTGEANPSAPARLVISPAEAFSYAYANTRSFAHFDAYLTSRCRELGADCVTITYEALVGRGRHALFGRIRERLGLDALRGAGRELPAIGEDDAPRWIPCEDRVANWHDLRHDRLLGRTIWVAMCRNGNKLVETNDLYGNYSIFVKRRVITALDDELGEGRPRKTTTSRLAPPSSLATNKNHTTSRRHERGPFGGFAAPLEQRQQPPRPQRSVPQTPRINLPRSRRTRR